MDKRTLRAVEAELAGRLDRLQRSLLSPSTPREQVEFLRGGAHQLEQFLLFVRSLADQRTG